jgi:hypothetical protein
MLVEGLPRLEDVIMTRSGLMNRSGAHQRDEAAVAFDGSSSASGPPSRRCG